MGDGVDGKRVEAAYRAYYERSPDDPIPPGTSLEGFRLALAAADAVDDREIEALRYALKYARQLLMGGSPTKALFWIEESLVGSSGAVSQEEEINQ